MQQAKSIQSEASVATSGPPVPSSKLKNQFVINLCAATSPVGLTPPDHAGLKRFNFFVSRRREEGRERFRLHMGYFATQEEAEKLLDIVREIYPGAWAGLAPGQRLRNQDAAQSPIDAAAHALIAPEASAAPASAPALVLAPQVERTDTQPEDVQHSDQAAAAAALSNVRAAIASLDDTANHAPTLRPIPELAAQSAPGSSSELSLEVTGAYKISAAALPPAEAPSGAGAEVSAETALSVLESGDKSTDSTVIMPRRDLQSAATKSAPSAAHSPPRDEKATFAVQLLWSVQPIDMAQIPRLAIFSAYTLYGAEGNRDGRRWYGVRLGFFTDAVSAKQVAHYVRSDFSTVSVVPVTVRERERAKLAATRPIATPVSPSVPAEASAAEVKPAAAEFVFLDDKEPKPLVRTAATVGRPSSGPPGKRAKLRTARQVNARAKAKSMTLEETLEILGAGQLEMDDGRTATINDSAARHSRSAAANAKSSRIGRLLERLSERLGG
jgi:hypothetical protein